MLKRIADWLEKVSVAAFAVGIFQNQLAWGLTVCVAALAVSLIMTKRLGGSHELYMAWCIGLCLARRCCGLVPYPKKQALGKVAYTLSNIFRRFFGAAFFEDIILGKISKEIHEKIPA